MSYPPADDRLRHLLAQRINCHVDTWKLAFFIAGALVDDPEIRAELDRMAAAHAAGEPCGDRNCRTCFAASTTAPAAVPVPPPADRAAVLREAADAVFALDYDELVGEEGDENLGSMREAWDLGTIHATELLRRMAAEEQPAADVDLTDGSVRCPLCTTTVTLHTPSGARAHFTAVHPEQRITGRGPGPWPLLVSDGDEALPATERPAVGEQPETQETP